MAIPQTGCRAGRTLKAGAAYTLKRRNIRQQKQGYKMFCKTGYGSNLVWVEFCLWIKLCLPVILKLAHMWIQRACKYSNAWALNPEILIQAVWVRPENSHFSLGSGWGSGSKAWGRPRPRSAAAFMHLPKASWASTCQQAQDTTNPNIWTWPCFFKVFSFQQNIIYKERTKDVYQFVHLLPIYFPL